MTKARVLSDSFYNGVRCVTVECEYPRYILSQVNTHRVFSRNTASSRAIPLLIVYSHAIQPHLERFHLKPI